jgi:hypothetical protein
MIPIALLAIGSGQTTTRYAGFKDYINSIGSSLGRH